ncbi:MAG: UDP-2,3-diacylglucosamine diphosphatase [bacterium]
MPKNIFFISDIHLGLEDREREKLKERSLVGFLNFAKENACELYILGDLYDYWFEYKRVMQKNSFRILTAIQDVCESGVKVHYLIGNHDFMHRSIFETELGVELHEDILKVEIYGKKFFLGHGDGLVKNDIGYKILKKILRNKFFQWLFSLIHPDIGIKIASHTSKTSREYTSGKHYGEIDGLFETARNKIDDGYDFVLFGHSHQRAFEKYKNGFYINLGSWIDKPCYGSFNGNNFEIIEWN